MGEAEKKYLDDLFEETGTLFVLWHQWKALFEQPKERLAQMGKAGSLLFGSIERVFYRDVALGICRLTDPERDNKGNHNISIRYFQSGCPYEQDSRLQEFVSDAITKADAFRVWRNKRLSHIDAATGIGWKPPQGCGRVAVAEALQAIAAVLLYVSSTFRGTELLLGGQHARLLEEQIRVPIERALQYFLQGYRIASGPDTSAMNC